MKIVMKAIKRLHRPKVLRLLTMGLLATVMYTPTTYAADAMAGPGTPSPTPSAPTPLAATAVNSVPSGSNPTATSTINAPPSINLPAGSTSVSGDLPTAPDSSADNSDKKSNKNLKSLENKVADSAKDVVKRLGGAAGDLTLEDLNAAKVTVAKIDALIEIEKHLADLDKIREERSKISGGSLSSIPQIPATAFQPPSLPIMPSRQMSSDEMPPVTMQPVSAIEVARILGADGHYSAVLSLSGGQTKVVHVGDKLADGSVVTGISPKGVDLQGSRKTQVLLVKGVDKVYGRSL